MECSEYVPVLNQSRLDFINRIIESEVVPSEYMRKECSSQLSIASLPFEVSHSKSRGMDSLTFKLRGYVGEDWEIVAQLPSDRSTMDGEVNVELRYIHDDEHYLWEYDIVAHTSNSIIWTGNKAEYDNRFMQIVFSIMSKSSLQEAFRDPHS